MLSSESAAENFPRVARHILGRSGWSRSIEFLRSRNSRPSLRKAQLRFNLPEKFALLANQFWTHKNHLTVIEALAELRRHDIKVPLVMTGRPAI